MRYTLYTYRDIAGIRAIEKNHEIKPFIFKETLSDLEENPDICIEISALIHYLDASPENRISAYINLRAMTQQTTVIIDEALANKALQYFPYLFSECVPYDLDVIQSEELGEKSCITWTRQPVYTYDNVSELDRIIEFAQDRSIPIATFSRAAGSASREFEKFNKAADLALLDLTSVSQALENSKNLIYLVENFFNMYPNIRAIVETSKLDNILEYFPLYFVGSKPIKELLPEFVNGETEEKKTNDSVTRVTDMDKDAIGAFFNNFEHNLIGHKYFKKRFKHAVKNFIALNKTREQKVFSVFLYGASGIGKTEVARLIANGIQENSYLARINFQNYSSQDALNSLIGSPAGYIGCDHGELSDKIGKTKVGVLLCDEFDKTTRPVFLFFLELLEEGRFTDSMAREYELDGFIIVFTSNIQTENEYKQTIPLELQTRFDLVCEFEKPNPNEKRDFLKLLYENAKEKHADSFSRVAITADDEKYLLAFDCSDLTSLRDIKRVFNNRLMDLFESKGLL